MLRCKNAAMPTGCAACRYRLKMQYAELTALRKPIERLDTRLAAVYREVEDAVLHRLDLAMEAFFRRCKRGETPGFPRFKPAARWSQLTFPHGDRALKFDGAQSRVTILGVGSVKLRKGRAVPAFGRAWLVLGIDRGVHVLAATSDGVLHRNSAVGEKRKSAVARLQRELDAASVYAGSGRSRRCLNRCDPKRIALVWRRCGCAT